MISKFNLLKNNVMNEGLLINKDEKITKYKVKEDFFYFIKEESLKDFIEIFENIIKTKEYNNDVILYQYPNLKKINFLSDNDNNLKVDKALLVNNIEKKINSHFIFLLIFKN